MGTIPAGSRTISRRCAHEPLTIPHDPEETHSQSPRDAPQRHPTRVRSPHGSAHTYLHMGTMPFRIPRDPEKEFTIPFAIPRDPCVKQSHKGILHGYDPRTIPHTHLCKWIRSPSGSRTIPRRCLRSPPRSRVIQRRNTHNPLQDPAQRHPAEVRCPHDPAHLSLQMGAIPLRIPQDPEQVCLRSPHDPM